MSDRNIAEERSILLNEMAKKYPEDKNRLQTVKELMDLFDKFAEGPEDMSRFVAATALHAVVAALLSGGENSLVHLLLNFEMALEVKERIIQAVGEDGVKKLIKSLASGDTSGLVELKEKLNMDVVDESLPEIIPMGFTARKRGVG